MPGPLPDPHARRRNAPTIPTTDLPAGGRSGRIPSPPRRSQLGPAGRSWWRWAWRTPQAAAWDGGGFDEMLARRASLEDDLAAIDHPTGLDLEELAVAVGLPGFVEMVRSLAGLVGGRLGIIREMRELDDRLGLSPKGLAALRWRVVAPVIADAGPAIDEIEERRAARYARALAETAPAAVPEKPGRVRR